MNNFKKDYYQILEIKTSSTTDEIKLAYRKQVKKYHPDLHPENTEYEGLIRDINEAYEVLRNKDERFAYDQYLLNKKAKQKDETASGQPVNKNKRTYTKTTTVDIEERTYLKGKIFIKYFGKHDEKEVENILRETFYKITVTETEAFIENIHKQHLTKEFKDVFASNKPITLNIKQPINCKVSSQNGNVVDYKLEILDLTIPSPELIDVTKHEGESFGTMTGTFYGYVKETKTYEENIVVEECYGETGRTEKKNEGGKEYFRKEYYNSDCTKYWGNWTVDPVRKTAQASANSQTRSYSYGKDNDGCLGSFGGIFGALLSILFILFLIPQLGFLLPFFAIPFLFNLIPSKIGHWFAKIAFALFGLIFLLAIMAAITSKRDKESEQAGFTPKPRIIKPTYTPVLDSQSNQQLTDTLISHHIYWNDYHEKTYEGTFSVKKSAVNQAHLYKENLNIPFDTEYNYDKIIFSLKEKDNNQLEGFYVMLDSLRLKNKPNQMEFAEIIVSLVQSIPYTLVLPKSCDAQFYEDEYTLKYLKQPNARCDGYQKYGINTPVEFLAYLNGDCDTRTLFLYSVLSHYKYDIVLLSSEHYSHSVLGINLPYDGVSFNYDSQRYVFWETTVQNLKPGILSNEISNLQYWRISLKSK